MEGAIPRAGGSCLLVFWAFFFFKFFLFLKNRSSQTTKGGDNIEVSMENNPCLSGLVLIKLDLA